MANLVFAYDGSDATQDLTFVSSTVGTVASATDQKYTGPRALKLSTGGPATTAQALFNGVCADAGRRISARMRFDAWAGGPAVMEVRTAANAGIFTVQKAAGGQLAIAAVGATTVTGTIVLVANQWYRLTLSYVVTNATTWQVKLYIDGVLDVSMNSTGTLTNTVSGLLRFTAGAGLGANKNAWIDDLYIDDGTDLADPGSTNVNCLRVTNKRPFANGTTNGFTTQIGSGNSGYGSGHADEVNEQPLSTTNGWSMVGAGAVVTEEYTIEGASVGDFDLTGYDVVGKMGWIYAKALASETGQIVTDGATSNISLTSTNTLFTKPVTSTTYPAGGTDIGIVTDTTLTTVSLFEAGVLVVASLSAGRTTKNTRAFPLGMEIGMNRLGGL
jgi:hypothetical protein